MTTRSVSYTNSRDHRRYSRCACDTTKLHDIIIHLPIDGFWFRKLGLLRKMDEVSLSATKNPCPSTYKKCELTIDQTKPLRSARTNKVTKKQSKSVLASNDEDCSFANVDLAMSTIGKTR